MTRIDEVGMTMSARATRAHCWAGLLIGLIAACGTKAEPAGTEVNKPEPIPSSVKTAAKPSERPSVAIEAGTAWVYGSACGLKENEITKEKLETKQTAAAFTIDVDTVSCAEWEACVAAGACETFTRNETGPSARTCLDDKAMVGRDAARGFCQWHGARLPTGLEWIRAAHGDEKFPNAHLPPRCGKPLHPERSNPSFPCKTEAGMLFTIAAADEWTSDEDCNFRGERKPVMVSTSDVFTVNRPLKDGAWFRCAH